MEQGSNSEREELIMKVGERRYEWAELKANVLLADSSEPLSPEPLSPNEHQAFEFAKKWLNNQGHFTIRTSGSTGKPKPIEITRSQMVESALATGKALGLQQGQRALICLPLQYIAGRMMLVRSFVLRLQMQIVEPASDPFALLTNKDFPFDFTAVVPLQMQALLNGPASYKERLNAMAAILVGGGPVSTTLHSKIQELSAPVYQTFGMTETVTHFALRRLNGPHASSAFIPLPGVYLGTDERGCLNVRSSITKNQTLQTNDQVILQGDGSFIWQGRWDNVINSGGVKVHPEVVEQAIEQVIHELGLPDSRFFVTGLPDERLGEQVTVIFEGSHLGADVELAIRSALSAGLSSYEIPRAFLSQSKFSETPTGKIDRPKTLERIQVYK
ncbi:MAG: AMP-binding protein [Chloroflexota bacterium]